MEGLGMQGVFNKATGVSSIGPNTHGPETLDESRIPSTAATIP